jgi:hypothetical protein
MCPRVAWVACLAAAAAALSVGACGSSSSSDESGPPAAGADALGAITIQAPVDGARLKAKQSDRGTLRARVRVRGRAAAGREVFLSASCEPAVCRARIRADKDGRWAVTLALKVSRATSFVTIDANARRDVVAAGSAVATVELVGPARPRAPRRRASTRRRPSSSGDGASAPSAPSRPSLPPEVLVIGDSLALGIEQPLQAALPGWRVRVDGRIGRPLAEGMGILGRQPDPPAILAFALFTNDGPQNTDALEAAVRATATRPGNCAVWSTIVRPPEDGVSYAAANTLLRGLGDDPELALGLELVDWAAAVSRSPSLVSPGDGVHGTVEGYGVLARLYADAIQSCAG